MFGRRRKQSDFAAEIEAHLDLEADRLRESGLSEQEARAAASRAFGNVTMAQERFYEARRLLWWDNLQRDLRSAFRTLSRERSFASFAILLIGLGAGLATTMFSLFDAVALRKLDVPDPDALIHIVALKGGGREGFVPYAVLERLKDDLDVADSLFGYTGTIVAVTSNGETQMASTQFVSGDYYRTMGARPLLGRILTPADDGPVAVISDAYWRRIGKAPDIVGKVIRAGPVALTVVGVVPAACHEIIRFSKADIIVPFRIGMLLESVPPEHFDSFTLDVTARLKPGVTPEQAQQRLDALWPRLLAETLPAGHSLEEWTRQAGTRTRVLPGNRGRLFIVQDLSRVTLTLFLLAGLVLLAMCSNLAGLLLSRGLGRQKEYALRLALGARRWHLVRHALVEVLILSVFGGAAAILLARWLTELCVKLLLAGRVWLDYGVSVDARVVGFALFLSVVTAVAAQIIPALRLSRLDVADAIKLGTPTLSARLGGRKAVLVAQVAAALVLVSGSLLFARTIQLMTRVEVGFRADNVLAIRLTGKVPWVEAGPEFFHELLRRVRAIPSVAAAGLADRVPMEMQYERSELIQATRGRGTIEVTSDRGCAWPGFFDALQIPVLSGRDFRESDTNAVILTRELARRLFPGGEAPASYVRVGKAPRAEAYQVVGVIGDVRFRSTRQAHTRMLFVPCRYVWTPPQTAYAMALAIRATGTYGQSEAAVRREIEAMGKQAIVEAVPLTGLISWSMRKEMTLTATAIGFGLVALILACAGVYALIDLVAAARRRELGVRMALGASSQAVLRFMMREAGQVVALGACIGLLASAVVARLYQVFLFGVAGFEPLLMTGALAVVVLCALLASLAPAWRATRLDPASVLRMGL